MEARTRESNLRGRSGISLIEVLIALMVMTVVGAGITRLLGSSYESEMTIQSQNECQRRAQQAVDKIVDGLRGFSEVETAGANALEAAQNDKNSVLVRTITYYHMNDAIYRDTYEVATADMETGIEIVSGVSALQFEYYHFNEEAGGWELAVLPEEAEMVKVAATISSGKNHATETSWVKFRNRM